MKQTSVDKNTKSRKAQDSYVLSLSGQQDNRQFCSNSPDRIGTNIIQTDRHRTDLTLNFGQNPDSRQKPDRIFRKSSVRRRLAPRSTIALMSNYYSAILPPWAPPPSLTHHQLTQWVISRMFLVIHKINSFVFKMIHSNFLVFYNKNYSLIFLQLVFEFIKHVFNLFLNLWTLH